MKVCYLLCGLLISFVSVVPDCVTAECCDCLCLSAASAVTPHFFTFFIRSLTVEREQPFRDQGYGHRKAQLSL